MCEASTTASAMSCVTRSIVQPWRRRSSITRSCRRSRRSASKAEKGSSMKRTSGEEMSARPSARRWRCPPESDSGKRRSNPVSSSSSSIALPFFSISSRGALPRTSGSVRFSQTRFQGKSASPCQTKLVFTSVRGTVRPSPSQATSPPSGRVNPATVERKVLFPQPDGPTTASDAPAGSVRSSPRRIGRVLS